MQFDPHAPNPGPNFALMKLFFDDLSFRVKFRVFSMLNYPPSRSFGSLPLKVSATA